MGFSSYEILIFLGVIVILSYLFDVLSKLTRVPSVLMLLGTGLILKYVSIRFHFDLPDTKPLLELFGIIGLILIVLEGSLDLELSREKLPLIKNSIYSALFILVATSFAIGYIIHYFLDATFHQSLLTAIPLGVISSAVAIPSIKNLIASKREFLVYEATFSDILGIMLFNFVMVNEVITGAGLLDFSLSLILIIIISIVGGLLLMFFIEKISHHIKFFLVIAVLVIVYSVGKMVHLSSLLLVLAFGMTINNTHLIVRGKIAKYFEPGKIHDELEQLKMITAESAFLIRTFFFLLFGFSFTLETLLDLNVIVIGGLGILSILIVRFLYLRVFTKNDLMPDLFIAPRGLITILLYYSIPPKYQIPGFSEGILFLIILTSSLMMMMGLVLTGDHKIVNKEIGQH